MPCLCHLILISLELSIFFGSRAVVPNLFGTRDWFHGRQLFCGLGLGWEWFLDDSGTLNLLCSLFLMYYCHWSNRRYWFIARRLGTLALEDIGSFTLSKANSGQRKQFSRFFWLQNFPKWFVCVLDYSYRCQIPNYVVMIEAASTDSSLPAKLTSRMQKNIYPVLCSGFPVIKKSRVYTFGMFVKNYVLHQ